MRKKILLIAFIALAFSNSLSIALAATYEDLISQAQEFDRQASLKQIEVDNLCVSEGATESTACKTAKSQLSSLKLQAESRRQTAENVKPGGKTQDPCEIRGDCPKPQKADPNYKLIVPIPGLSAGSITNPLDYIKGIYNFAIGFGLLIAVATIVFAGLKWATSAGNVSATGEAKDMILNAVYGVVMLLGAILILSTISPTLTKLTIPELTRVGNSGFDFSSIGGNDSYSKALDDLSKINRAKQATIQELAKQREILLTNKSKITGTDIDSQIARQMIDVQVAEIDLQDAQLTYDNLNTIYGVRSADYKKGLLEGLFDSDQAKKEQEDALKQVDIAAKAALATLQAKPGVVAEQKAKLAELLAKKAMGVK